MDDGKALLSDSGWLRREQYVDSARLGDRRSLHDRFSTNPQGWYRWLFERLELSPGARVLEVGAGPGWLWLQNRERLPRLARFVLGDASPGMVREARAGLGEAAVRAEFAAFDAQRLPFPDESFEGLIANHMLYHVPDRPAALAELRRVLAPGGRLYAATNGARHLFELDELALLVAPDSSGWMLAPSEAFGLENGAEQLGDFFRDVELERYEDGLRITEAEPLVAYLLSMRSLARVGEDAAARLREHVTRQLARFGQLHVTKSVGLFRATRR